jgi:hypothetical protein
MNLNPEILVPKLVDKAREYVQSYFSSKHLLGVRDCDELRASLRDPLVSARVFFGQYAFERAGTGGAHYSDIAADLLKGTVAQPDAPAFLSMFRHKCREIGVGSNDDLTGEVVLKGYQRHFCDGRKLGWLYELGQGMVDTGQVRPAYRQLLDIKGIGQKIAAFFCRDLAWIFDCEKNLPASERILLQPVDTWIHQIAVLLWHDFPPVKAREKYLLYFPIAARIVSVTDQLRQSGVAFNQGSWYFGSREVVWAEKLETQLAELQEARS